MIKYIRHIELEYILIIFFIIWFSNDIIRKGLPLNKRILPYTYIIIKPLNSMYFVFRKKEKLEKIYIYFQIAEFFNNWYTSIFC